MSFSNTNVLCKIKKKKLLTLHDVVISNADSPPNFMLAWRTNEILELLLSQADELQKNPAKF